MTGRRILAGVLAAVPAVALTAAVAVAGITHTAPVGGFVSAGPVDDITYAGTAASKPGNVPTWRTHGAGTVYSDIGCAPLAAGVPVLTVLAVDQDNRTRVLTFDDAWRRSHNGPARFADDVWAIGTCDAAAGR